MNPLGNRLGVPRLRSVHDRNPAMQHVREGHVALSNTGWNCLAPTYGHVEFATQSDSRRVRRSACALLGTISVVVPASHGSIWAATDDKRVPALQSVPTQSAAFTRPRPTTFDHYSVAEEQIPSRRAEGPRVEPVSTTCRCRTVPCDPHDNMIFNAVTWPTAALRVKGPHVEHVRVSRRGAQRDKPIT